MQNIGTFIVSKYLPPASPLYVNTGGGWEYIRLINDSPYQLSVDVYGGIGALTIPEFFMQDISVPPQYGGSMKITPSINITSASHAQSASLSINAYGKGEITSPTSQSIPQQAVNPTATGNPIFTAQFGLGASANNVQTLNVYNPANSGTDLVFHAAKAFTNSPGVPTAVLSFIAGSDLNLATPVSTRPHTLQANPPVSVAHCTFDDTAGGHGGTPVETQRLTGSVSNETSDLLAFPDVVIVKPGVNLLLTCVDTTAGHTIQIALKWTEQTSVPAPNLAGVVILTAANIVNDGNAAGTGIVESTVAGDGASAVFLTNDAQFTLGDAAHQSVVTIDGTAIINGTGSPALDLSSSTGAKSMLIGNNKPIQSKDSGGTARDILYVDAGNVTDLQAAALGGNVSIKDQNGNAIANFAAALIQFINGTTNVLQITSTGPTLNANMRYNMLTGSISRFTGFSGTGSGTVNTNLGTTPNQISFNPCTVSGSSQTIGGTIAQSSVVTTGSGLAWGGMAFKDIG